jgi:hypothetical protein
MQTGQAFIYLFQAEENFEDDDLSSTDYYLTSESTWKLKD